MKNFLTLSLGLVMLISCGQSTSTSDESVAYDLVGVEFYNEFMDDMEPWDFDEMMGPTKYGCIGVPDHGSVIPHCGIDMNIIPGGKKEWYWKIYNRTTGDLSISVTRDYQNSKSKLFMSWLEPWLVSDNAQVNVVFKHYPTILDILRAVLVVFAEVDYTDEKIMVTHNAS